MHITASADDETWSIYFQITSLFGRKVWNVVTGVTGDLKWIMTSPLVCYGASCTVVALLSEHVASE